MSDSFVQLPVVTDTTGKKTDSSQIIVGSNAVERQRINIADPASAAAIASVTATPPASDAYGLVTRQIPNGTETTAAKQDTGNASLASLLSALTSVLTALQGTLATSAAALPLPAGAATQATLAGVLAALQGSGTVNVGNFPATSGTVTANAGLNLNTSALALEAGNLAALVAKDFATQTTLAAILAKLIAAPATETTLSALSGKIPALGSAAASASLPVVATIAGVVYADCSGTITAGGTAQQLVAANASRRVFFIQNNSDGDLWINSVTTAVLSQPSLRLPAGALYESPANGVPVTAISIIGATTGQTFSAREY